MWSTRFPIPHSIVHVCYVHVHVAPLVLKARQLGEREVEREREREGEREGEGEGGREGEGERAKDSLVPRPYPAFQCCTLKNGRAWYLKSRARARLLRNKHLENGRQTNHLVSAYGAFWLVVERLPTD